MHRAFRTNILAPSLSDKTCQVAGVLRIESSGLIELNRLSNSSIEAGLPRRALEIFIEMAVKAHQGA